MAGVDRLPIRVGHGFDVHRLAPGRALILGGCRIPCEKGLDGHSDGDVVLHAVADAILGAVAEGDIGTRFPASDEAFRGISGEAILREAISRARARGWKPAQVDTTIVAETPRLAPHQYAVREALARLLDLSADAVSVKVKSAEGLGVVGAGGAIAAFAVAVVAAVG